MAIKIKKGFKPHIDSAETDELVFRASSQKIKNRLLNPDGNFNIERKGLYASNLYEIFLSMSWTRIILSFLTFYFVINSIFALFFLLIGPQHIEGTTTGGSIHNFTQMLYFSIQTFTTVGYGHLNPSGTAANLLASFVAFSGLLMFAIVTGLSFAKFSKPQAHILFSDKILFAPNPNKNDEKSLQFRIVNATHNQIIDLESRVTLTWMENENGSMKRRFIRLDLELENIHLFPLNWTIIHMINKNSPLYGLDVQEIMKNQMELLVLIKGFDDTYSQIIHSKRSYSFDDLIEGARFISMYEVKKSKTILHLSKLNDYEPFKFEEIEKS